MCDKSDSTISTQKISSRFTTSLSLSLCRSDSQEAANESTSSKQAEHAIPRVVVFGGSGFVGSKVCQQAIEMGVNVTSISRSGRPRHLDDAKWADEVEWIRSDGTKSDGQWKATLDGACGVISTLGAFGSNSYMYQMCGEVNMNIMDAAKDANVSRFAFISVHDFMFPGGWQAQNFLLRGYFQGKRDAEARLFSVFPDSGIALRPGMIYGTRHTGTISVPLGVIGMPLEAVMKKIPSKSLASTPIIGAMFVPPVSVDAVGKAAASAVLDPSVPPGIMDVWEIQKYS